MNEFSLFSDITCHYVILITVSIARRPYNVDDFHVYCRKKQLIFFEAEYSSSAYDWASFYFHAALDPNITFF